jgi:hypothetical protein
MNLRSPKQKAVSIQPMTVFLLNIKILIAKAIAESKYRIRDYNIDKNVIEVIVKLSPTGKIVIITVYAL